MNRKQWIKEARKKERTEKEYKEEDLDNEDKEGAVKNIKRSKSTK